MGWQDSPLDETPETQPKWKSSPLDDEQKKPFFGPLDKVAKGAGETLADAVTGAVPSLVYPPLAALGAAASYVVPARGGGDMYPSGTPIRERFRNEMENLREGQAKAFDRSPVANTLGSVAPLAIAPQYLSPFSTAASNGTITAKALAGAADLSLLRGASAGLGNVDKTNAPQLAADAALDPTNVIVGGGIPLAAGLIGKGGKALIGKAADIEGRMAQSAAQKALDETLTARSAAGRSAQEVVRALEKIEEFKGAAPEIYEELVKSGAVKELQKEYLMKAGKDLPLKVFGRDTAAKEFSEMAKSEAQRAAQKFEESITTKAAVSPLAKSLRRYLGRAATGAALGYIGGDMLGMDPKAGAGIGALGLNMALAPTLLKNATNPGMKRLVYGKLGSAAMGLSSTTDDVVRSQILSSILRKAISPNARLQLSSAIAEDEQ